MAHVALTPEVTDILKRSTIAGNALKLPPAKLDRSLYEKVNKALTTAGGRWKGGKVQAHVFDGDPREALGMALTTGIVVDQKKVRQAYYTPDVIALEVAALGDVTGMVVLEPSAGDGALARACLNAGAARVECIEMEPKCRTALEEIARAGVTVGDFLTMVPRPVFARVVMNPPFTRGLDVKHIAQALRWLEPGGWLVSVVPDKDCPKLAAMGARTLRHYPSGAFKESGTMIATRVVGIRG